MPSADQLSRTCTLGIIGYPLDRTASPAVQNTALRLARIPWIYAAFRVPPDSLAAALEGLRTAGVLGFNVTYPHKEKIIPQLEKVTPTAREIGAVNTVWRTPRGWQGDNTDLHGFNTGLKSARRRIRNAPAVLFGTGGAARTAAYALIREFGISALLVVSRNPARATAFVRWVSALDPNIPVDIERLASLRSWRSGFKAARTVVNATPVGMTAGGRGSILPAGVRFHPDQIVHDLIYGRSTPFLQRARRAGATVIGGDTMFWHQAARAFEIWTGKRFPLKRVQSEVRL